jgi:hypothetical protein
MFFNTIISMSLNTCKFACALAKFCLLDIHLGPRGVCSVQDSKQTTVTEAEWGKSQKQ